MWQSKNVDGPYNWQLSNNFQKICPKLKNGRLSHLPIESLDLNFLNVLFRRFLICQSHITSHSSDKNHTTSHLVLKKLLGKSNLTHLPTDVMFSGQRFAILAMFLFFYKSAELLGGGFFTNGAYPSSFP